MPTVTIPAPFGGLNARDAVTAMPAQDAIRLFDWIPRGTFVETAPPVEEFYAGPNRVFTLAPYEVGASKKLLAAVETSAFSDSWDIVEVSTGTPSTLKAAQGDGIYSFTIFNSLMVLCNGVDTPQVYNGTTCSNIAVTGVTASTLRGVITFKGRCYYWQNNAQSFWSAAAGSYQGALAEFPVSTFTTLGGKVTLLCTITRDGGEGADDLFCVVMSTGEILVYQGDDPAGAFSWEMIGRFKCPRPLGIRSAHRYGRTTLLMTEEGVIDIAAVLSGTIYPAFSDKVIAVTTLKDDNYASGDSRDLACAVDSQESMSTMFLPNNVYTQFPAFSSIPICIERATGQWWNYIGSAGDFLSGGVGTPACACSFDGRTYFGASSATGSSILVIQAPPAPAFVSPAVISKVWRNCSVSGISFAVTFNSTVLTDYYNPENTTLAPYTGVSSYQPAPSFLISQATAVQTVYDSSENYWGSTPKLRWYMTNLRIKTGGKR